MGKLPIVNVAFSLNAPSSQIVFLSNEGKFGRLVADEKHDKISLQL